MVCAAIIMMTYICGPFQAHKPYSSCEQSLSSQPDIDEHTDKILMLIQQTQPYSESNYNYVHIRLTLSGPAV